MRGLGAMTALNRKVGERLRIGDQVVLTVSEVRGQRVQLKIDAPEGMTIWRQEV
jgi:carbon storage regulator